MSVIESLEITLDDDRIFYVWMPPTADTIQRIQTLVDAHYRPAKLKMIRLVQVAINGQRRYAQIAANN